MKFRLLIIIALINVEFFSQRINEEIQIRIDSIVTKCMEDYSIVGLSIGIIDYESNYNLSYGVTDLEEDNKITENTMFHIASISKLFTTTAIMQLVEKGKLNLSDRIVDVLFSFEMKDPRHKEITIAHLLTHSSGLLWDNKIKNSPDDRSSIQLFLENLENKKLLFSPGEKSSFKTYSNAGFDLLGLVVEELSKLTFDQYVKTNILEPVGMKNSTYFYEELDSVDLAFPQIVSGKSRRIEKLNLYGVDSKRNPIVNGKPLTVESYSIYGEEYEHNPSGNLISSSVELVLWMNHLLKIYEDPNFVGVLKRESLIELWSRQRQIDEKFSFGYCWWIDNKEDKVVYHGGSHTGFSCLLSMNPDQHFGITILCNGMYGQVGIWKDILKQIELMVLEVE